MGCPVYLVHGTGDQLISTAHSENIYEALGGEKKIWFVEGARHARSILHARREYSERMSEFFTEPLNGQCTGGKELRAEP